MAKPTKRRIEGDDGAEDSSATTSKRVTAKGTGSPSRYTPKTVAASKMPSPRWVPVLMFTLWGAGLLVIVLNYMGVLPGSSDGGNGWYLVGGLVAILTGIMVSTRYR
ncbi:MAG: cell division protein CrgA [Actinomycetes bacterium]